MRVTDDAGQRWYSLWDARTPCYFFPFIHYHSFRQVMKEGRGGEGEGGSQEGGLASCLVLSW